MIEKAQRKGLRRLLLRIAVAGALTAIPMAAVAAPAFAAPASVPGVVQVDGQHNQGHDGWHKNRGHDERHNQRHDGRHDGRGQNAWYGQRQHRPC